MHWDECVLPVGARRGAGGEGPRKPGTKPALLKAQRRANSYPTRNRHHPSGHQPCNEACVPSDRSGFPRQPSQRTYDGKEACEHIQDGESSPGKPEGKVMSNGLY